MRVEIDEARCIGCSRCADDCVADDLRIQNGIAQVLGRCILCGHCVAVCPTGAVSISGYDMADVEPAEPLSRFVDAHDLLQAIKSRRSIRRYRPCAVERQKIDLILQAGRYTATAKNAQGCRFVVVQDGLDELKRLVWGGIEDVLASPGSDRPRWAAQCALFLEGVKAEPSRDFLFRNAPAVVFVVADRADDAGLASQNMELMAASLGLGMLFNGYLCRAAEGLPAVKSWLEVQDRPLQTCMLLGYPAVTYRRTAPRLPGDFVVK
ncbi:nitroreductase [Paraeggerthella hongkongensis]|uniref:nitroreductase family protein n=1 Tax=Paraeggerthella sp. TaxID=2897350 RepID=UPI000DF83600|nr:nitroreductase [Paraeggerthella hongkongensis]